VLEETVGIVVKELNRITRNPLEKTSVVWKTEGRRNKSKLFDT
jgi:hypothetical protein